MNQTQLAKDLKISTTSVGRYSKGLSLHYPNLTYRSGRSIIYDEKACRAIKYVNDLVRRGLNIGEAVIPVLRDIYEIDVEQKNNNRCKECVKLQEQLDTYSTLFKQQQATIAILTKELLNN